MRGLPLRRRPCRHALRLPPLSRAGVSTFAEDPSRPFDDARIIWSAAVDPSVLTVSAYATADGSFDLPRRSRAVAIDGNGREHVAIRSPGGLLRLDVVSGSVLAGPVALRVHLNVDQAVAPRLSALDRLLRAIGLTDPGRRPARPDARLARLVDALRVSDALADGASLSRIAAALRGTHRLADTWPGEGDNIKSAVRRRVALARQLTARGPAGVMRYEL
jgi:hypothetical protein